MTVLDPNYDPATDGAMRKAGAAAVRPRDAATLIVVRRDGPQPRVLMGRRNRGHDFMPGKWVFPGGGVDRGDARAPAAAELRPEVAAKLALTAPERRPALPRALALAAVRETFEEAGLLLAKPAAPRPGVGPWRPFLALGAAPDLSALTFVARAITPPYRPKRFDARFFMAEASALLSLERAPDCGELGRDRLGRSARGASPSTCPTSRASCSATSAERLDDPGGRSRPCGSNAAPPTGAPVTASAPSGRRMRRA
jgi:8-oxo-dGTP pyrophosphatase MutT (NUDIX family)